MKIYRVTTCSNNSILSGTDFVTTRAVTAAALERIRAYIPEYDNCVYTTLASLNEADTFDSLEEAINKAKFMRSEKKGVVYRIHIQDLDEKKTAQAKAFCLEKGLTKPYDEYDEHELYPFITKCQENGWNFLEVLSQLHDACYGAGSVEVLIISKAEKLLANG